jgi:hypothetical protein
VHDSPEEALEAALSWTLSWVTGSSSVRDRDDPACVMVTGSLYLVGALRSRVGAGQGSH